MARSDGLARAIARECHLARHGSLPEHPRCLDIIGMRRAHRFLPVLGGPRIRGLQIC